MTNFTLRMEYLNKNDGSASINNHILIYLSGNVFTPLTGDLWN